MRVNDLFLSRVITVFAIIFIASFQVKAEPYILLNMETIEDHDWSEMPPVMSGYEFINEDIKKLWMDKKTGKQQPDSLKWKAMSSNKRTVGDFEVVSRIKEYKDEFGGFEFLHNMNWRGPEEVSKNTRFCGIILRILQTKFGSPRVENDRSVFSKATGKEDKKWQWIKGNTTINGDCMAFTMPIGSNKDGVIFINGGFIAKSNSASKMMTPIIGLSCDFQPGDLLFKDGYRDETQSRKIKGSNQKFLIDVDETQVLNMQRFAMGNETKIDSNTVTAKWKNDKKVEFTLTISRIDGSASLRAENEDVYADQLGKCNKMDIEKKLF